MANEWVRLFFERKKDYYFFLNVLGRKQGAIFSNPGGWNNILIQSEDLEWAKGTLRKNNIEDYHVTEPVSSDKS